jgi:transcriptional regulator with XRE-family HTH domain
MVAATGTQLRAGRAMLRMRQQEAADRLLVSVHTVQRAEAGRVGSARTRRQLQWLLTAEGIAFTADGGVRRVSAPAQAEVRPKPVAGPTADAVTERRGGLARVDGVWWPAPRTA